MPFWATQMEQNADLCLAVFHFAKVIQNEGQSVAASNTNIHTHSREGAQNVVVFIPLTFLSTSNNSQDIQYDRDILFIRNMTHSSCALKTVH